MALLNKWIRERGDHGDRGLLNEVKSFVRSYQKFVPAEHLGICTDDLELGDASKWPMIPFRIGLAVVIVTRDKQVIVPLRSSHVSLGDTPSSTNAGAYTSSVGEGMTREDTVRGLHLLHREGAARRRRKGQRVGPREEEHHQHEAANAPEIPSLVTLAARALLDEMGIEDQIDCNVAQDVLCVSLNFDRHEAFPHLTTVLTTNCTFDEIKKLRSQKAKDASLENKEVLGLPRDEKTAKGLAEGEVEVQGKGKIIAASPREKIFFAQAAEAIGFGDHV